MPKETVKELDARVSRGRFKSRSDAIKSIVNFYEEREKTRKFYEMLFERSEEAEAHPKKLVPLGEI
jgi:Arc/MetJ-type ribon-helix-helix transcriptional regulator